MLTDNVTFWGLVVSAILIFSLAVFSLRMKKKTQLHKVFIVNCLLTLLWSIALIAQIIFSPLYGIEPIKFDYIVYIGACFLPVSLLFTGIVFANTKIKFSWKHCLLFIVPIISLLVLWTNDAHHLFYVHYSTNFSETVYGDYFNIHSIYSYVCIFIGVYFLISYAIKNSGFFSKQSILIMIGTLVPTIVNGLATFGILDISIYVTPITYIITIFCYAFAMFKFQLFKASPIALQKIVDRISDSYLVLNEDNLITDFNETFLTTFGLTASNVRNVNIFDLLSSSKEKLVNEEVFKDALQEVRNSSKTVYFEKPFPSFHKHFHIEMNTITSKGNFLGTLVLLKDTTQHIQDMQTIQDNQEMLMEKERLASLGQLIGGIAHNLKTPIMSISGAAEGLNDLIKEYDASIGDPEVNENDHHDIARDMAVWTQKIKEYSEYMSDVITAVKGQAVVMSEQDSYLFTVEELVKRVDILMRHELKNALINLKVSVMIDGNTELKGNVNSLVQVINNMISNSIQAYNGRTNENIELTISEKNSNVIISVKDYAGGLPKEISDKLFKEMVTTKGKNGTGLGLFMSYSNIRAHFNGNITVDSDPGVGTEFHIILPL